MTTAVAVLVAEFTGIGASVGFRVGAAVTVGDTVLDGAGTGVPVAVGNNAVGVFVTDGDAVTVGSAVGDGVGDAGVLPGGGSKRRGADSA